ncbi:glycoside hydrolase family 140 protein [Planctomycetota bacterium]
MTWKWFFILFFSILAESFHVQESIAQERKWFGKSVDFSHGRLIVSENQRFLIFEDGTPFFWLGDTAWELFHRLTKNEAERYLENRREKGFTVIQAVILAELDGLNVPNAEGEKPLIDQDPTRINENYFKHVDWVINKAEEKGMFIGLLPTWGDKVDKRWGIGPVIFNPENAETYGEFLGKRYKDVKNIIWINGGDRPVTEHTIPVWRALAKGIRKHDQNHLMTYHPNGAHSSSQWFHHEDWLDFNMIQTSHHERSYAAFIKLLIPDYHLKPVKPTLDGEPRYEHFPVNWDPELFGRFDDADVRQAAYWAVFTGAFGHTYGCHSVWQMNAPGREPVRHALHSWYDDLDLPGAWDMLHVRKLMESRPFIDRIPFQQIVKNEYFPETDYIIATRGKDYVMVYIPTGKGAKLALSLCGWPTTNVWWYNCKTGQATHLSKISTDQVKYFEPKTRGRGNDWVLILDNAARSFGPPGE